MNRTGLLRELKLGHYPNRGALQAALSMDTKIPSYFPFSVLSVSIAAAELGWSLTPHGRTLIVGEPDEFGRDVEAG